MNSVLHLPSNRHSTQPSSLSFSLSFCIILFFLLPLMSNGQLSLSKRQLSLSKRELSLSKRQLSLSKLGPDSIPNIHYRFTDEHIHDYSHNWDFDGDGVKDELYFVSTGGAHEYFFLRLALSADHQPRDYRFIQSDFPMLISESSDNLQQMVVGFVVTTQDENSLPTIIICIDTSTQFAFKEELEKRDINTRIIAIQYENGEMKFSPIQN